MRNAEKTVGNLLDKQKVVYLSSVDDEGHPNTKAMFAPRKRVGLRVFYFSTNTSSQRVAQFRQNPRACFYFCDRRFYKGAMLRGTIEVLEDANSKEMLWQKGDDKYYQKGVADPDYCVLKFTAMDGRYYSNLKSEDFAVADEGPM